MAKISFCLDKEKII